MTININHPSYKAGERAHKAGKLESDMPGLSNSNAEQWRAGWNGITDSDLYETDYDRDPWH